MNNPVNWLCPNWIRTVSAIFVVFVALATQSLSAADGFDGGESGRFQPLDPQLLTRTEALKRISPQVIKGSESMQKVVDQVLDSTAGHPVFVELSVRLGRIDRAEGLLDFAESHPDNYAAADAIRFLLRHDQSPKIEARLKALASGARFEGLIQLLAGSGAGEAFEILKSQLDAHDSEGKTGHTVIRCLCATRAGASTILSLHKNDLLPDDLHSFAGQMLSLIPWAEIRERAARQFPESQSHGAAGLTMGDLRAFKGDSERGRAVFNDPVVGCSRCHVVQGNGVRFGPELSLIGDKLSPEALLESIQSPSAGIAFGFEAWELELDTTEVLYGILTSETDEFVILRDSLGVDQKVDKSTILSRTKSPASAMPQGLARLMSPTQMADLIQYLQGLKASP